MDGAPIFNLVHDCLPAVRVLGFHGVLNSTSNLILGLMESGQTLSEALIEAQRLGIAEANADYDIDGWDAVLKAKALANVLMNAEDNAVEIHRLGIRSVTAEQLAAAKREGFALRLIARASLEPGRVTISVAPERVASSSILAVTSTSNVLVLLTDLMGELALLETEPGLRQTAYALLSDLLHLMPR
jgi:homoserine dehydrogenase